MQHSTGTRAVTAAVIALGLTFSLSACDTHDVGRSPVAVENKKAGVLVREDTVQQATEGWQQLQTAAGVEGTKDTPANVLQYLAIEPIYADAADKLGVGVSMDDARAGLQSEMDRIRSNRVGAAFPPITDPLLHVVRYKLLTRAIQDAPKDAKYAAVGKDAQAKMTSGWEFGQRYGGFAFSETGTLRLDPSRPWLDKYEPLNLGSTDNGDPTQIGRNGRPIEEARPTPAGTQGNR